LRGGLFESDGGLVRAFFASRGYFELFIGAHFLLEEEAFLAFRGSGELGNGFTVSFHSHTAGRRLVVGQPSPNI